MLKDVWRTATPMRRTLVVTVATGVAIALVRLGWWNFYIAHPGLFGFADLCIAAPVVCAIVPLLIFGVVWSIRRTRRLLPIGLLALGTILAFQIPLAPRPSTPEAIYFKAHRVYFEQVVEQARNKQFQRGECSDGYISLPTSSIISFEKCPLISNDASGDLKVTFFPPEQSGPYGSYLLYVEKPEKQNCLDAFDIEQIDEHWYVCFDDWL